MNKFECVKSFAITSFLAIGCGWHAQKGERNGEFKLDFKKLNSERRVSYKPESIYSGERGWGLLHYLPSPHC